MEDKRICPHCGHELHHQPYLMARDPDAEIDPRILWVMMYAVVFIAAFLYLSSWSS